VICLVYKRHIADSLEHILLDVCPLIDVRVLHQRT
jgi:hypothetical protein